MKLLVLALVLVTPLAGAEPPAPVAGVARVALPNGIPVYVAQDPGATLIHLTIDGLGGAAADPTDRLGLASVAVRALLQGAGDLDSAALRRALGALGPWPTVEIEASGSYLHVTALPSRLEPVLELLAKVLSIPTLADTGIAQARHEALAARSIAARAPMEGIRQAFRGALFGTHPFGRPPLGTAGGIAAVTTADVQAWVARYLTTGNLRLRISGPVPVATVVALLGTRLGVIRPGAKAPPPARKPGAMAWKRAVILPRPRAQAADVVLGGPGVGRAHADWFPLRVALEILGGGADNRLSLAVGAGGARAHSASAHLEPDAVWLHARVRVDQVLNTTVLLRAAIAGLSKDGPGKDELVAAKARLIGRHLLDGDTGAERIRRTGRLLEAGVKPGWNAGFEQRISAVSADGIKRVAKRWLTLKTFALAVAGPPKHLKGQLSGMSGVQLTVLPGESR